ncbi:MAG: protein kinase [Planctomycetaceae bacterium]|jgi:serine/threonine protein kinase|nr:protein kinase [Planctomycetaceae bacterium]
MDPQEIKEKFQQLWDDYHSNRIDWKTFEQQLFELKTLRLDTFSSAEHDGSLTNSFQTVQTAQIPQPRSSGTAISKSGRFQLQPLTETSLPLNPDAKLTGQETSNLPFFPTTQNHQRKNAANPHSTFASDADSPSRIFRSTGPLQVSRRTYRLDAGTRLGKDYTLQHVLGIGQCGETWLAEENSTGNSVVLKLIPPPIQKDEKALDLVSDSFRRASKLKYPGICPVFRLTQDEILGSFLVAAFADALPLNEYYKRYCQLCQELPFTVAVQLLVPVSQALDFAHRKKIVHRMLKPQNILVGKHCGVVITDFEFTETVRKELLRFGVETAAATTAAWKAPEVWTEQNESPYSDQFALGVLACQLITGSLPFHGKNEQELREKILHAEPVFEESLPEETRLTLQKALSKNPQDRFSNCFDFVKELSTSPRFNPMEQTSGFWPFTEKETILDLPDTFQQQTQTFPYVKKPKGYSGISFFPFDSISSRFSRVGLIATLLAIAALIIITGIVLWQFVGSSSPKNTPSETQNVDSAEKNKGSGASTGNVAPKANAPISPDELNRLVRLAAEENIDARRQLGEIYFYGNGVKPDYQKAIEYFLLSAQQGDIVSLYHIGRCYELGLGGLPHDTTQAISIYKQAKNYKPAAAALKRLNVVE